MLGFHLGPRVEVHPIGGRLSSAGLVTCASFSRDLAASAIFVCGKGEIWIESEISTRTEIWIGSNCGFL